MAEDWAKYKDKVGGGITYHYVIDFSKMASCNLRIKRNVAEFRFCGLALLIQKSILSLRKKYAFFSDEVYYLFTER